MAIGDELANLNFGSMIGGPLSAVINAQAQAAITSVEFIKAVGFHPDDAVTTTDRGKPVMVTFEYHKAVEQTDDGVTTTSVQPFELTVPILTMLPIPFIRIEETTIDFNAKITSVQESAVNDQLGFDASVSLKFKPVELKTSFSYKRSTSSSDKVERTYSLQVHVRAVQDEMPAGMERLLGILENSISEVQMAPKTS
jgi:hypothetical protein